MGQGISYLYTLRKPINLVSREILYNILIELHISMKIFR
jgi:hypothetical protein